MKLLAYTTLCAKLVLGILVIGYVGLLATTVYFASESTAHTRATRDMESVVSGLERTYYEKVETIHKLDYKELGFVTPTDVRYLDEDALTLSH